MGTSRLALSVPLSLPPALRLAPGVTLVLFLGPIVAGVAGTFAPAFGWLPAIGGEAFSLAPWRQLMAWPGFSASLRVTLTTGVAATALSLGIVVLFCAAAHGTALFRRAQGLVAPLLATPHAALAIGFAFLAAPSGMGARLVSPWLTGWTRPPDIATVNDAGGLALVAGLVLKEVPYLLLVTLAALNQVRAEVLVRAARTLGYGPVTAWLKAVFPLVYPQIRLPVYAVLAFSLSVVDVAMILGPGNPPTLSVLIVRWFSDRELSLWFPASAGALLLAGLVAAAIGLWRMGEGAVARAAHGWLTGGARGGSGDAPRTAGVALVGLIAVLSLSALLVLAAWSFAGAWRFPDALPRGWTTATWTGQVDALAGPARATIVVGAAATLAALVLALLCLEAEDRFGLAAKNRALLLLYLPLLLPQVSFLFGLQVMLVRGGLDGTIGAVVWAHLLFVLPYVFLTLADPWRAMDRRLARNAAALGAGPWRVFLAVKLPIMLRPVLIAAAVGFAVSVGQYLPTLFAGAGRIATLTTEAVTLAGGSDRRVVGAYALVQALLPLLAYAAALAVPAVAWRNRRGLAVA
ncbi:MAG: ABC transporter permease subunit [Acetobacteraceae bacterium]|jgi:putative thiamine transport system permease protein|nr:ABC transporter permease subunit [Acetobacteraceae bacterium]